MKPHLAKLERQLRRLDDGTCTLCFGLPSVVLVEQLEEDPDGPGFRRVGERRLHDDQVERVTPDGHCCRRCGRPARSVTIISSLADLADEQTHR